MSMNGLYNSLSELIRKHAAEAASGVILKGAGKVDGNSAGEQVSPGMPAWGADTTKSTRGEQR